MMCEGSFLIVTLALWLAASTMETEGLSITANRGAEVTVLANNSFYTVPFEVSVDPLLECVGMGTDWLHINGTVVSTNDHPATPLYQTYGPDRTQLHKGLTLTALDEGVFICAANSTGNRLLVTLHLPQGPLETPILDQTGRILLNLGDSITVRCDIPKHISPYPTLTWTKDGHTLHTDGHVNTSTPSSWHYRYLSLQLTINNFSPRDRGRYQCAADNGIQHTQSEIIYLDLKGVPALYSAHSTIHYFPGEGEELVMRVRASQYSTLQWAHNSSSITDDRGRHTLEDFGQTMRVSMATLEDSGNYSVYTTREECDGGMTDCKVGVVTIQVIPYGELDCTIAEDNTTLYTGSRLSLSCTVHGYPAPQVTWYHNGTKLHDSHVTSLKGSSVLAVSSVTMETSGMYTCQVEHLNPLTSKPSVKNSTQTVTIIPAKKALVMQVLLQLSNCPMHQVDDVITAVGNTLQGASADTFQILKAFFVCFATNKGIYRAEVVPIARHRSSEELLKQHLQDVLSAGVIVAIGNTMATSLTGCDSVLESLSSELCSLASLGDGTSTTSTSTSTREGSDNTVMIASIAAVGGATIATMATLITSCICIAILRNRILRRRLKTFASNPIIAITNPYSPPPGSRRPSPARVYPDDNMYQTVGHFGARSRSHSPLPSSAAKPSSHGIYHYAECTLKPPKGCGPKEEYVTMKGCGPKEEYVTMKGCGPKEEYVTMKGCGPKEEYVTMKGCGPKEENVTMKGCGPKEEYVTMKGCGPKEEYMTMSSQPKSH